MRDEEARFAAELARSVGRFDWWNIENEHTPYEWACQKAMYQVSPFGERRADLRAATNTVFQIVSSSMAKISEEDGQNLFQKLKNYLECHEDQDEIVDLEAVQKVRESDGKPG